MAKTAVGLFENRNFAEAVVHNLEASGFPTKDVRIVTEPRDMPVTSPTSTPRTDFQVDLIRQLRAMGARDEEAEACARGVKNHGALVLATGSDAMVASVTKIMNEDAGADVESLSADGGDLHLPRTVGEEKPAARTTSVQAGRASHSGEGPKVFIW